MNTDGIFPAEPLLTIVTAARRVLLVLSPGLEQKAYARALAIELRKWDVRLETDKVFEVRYDGQLVDVFIAPLVVDDCVLVDVRVAAGFGPTWLAQATGGLLTTGLNQALLLNFARPELDWRPLQRLEMPDQRFA
jgi:GxxExxY protein